MDLIIASAALMPSLELTPSAGLNVIEADGYMLYLVTLAWPRVGSIVVNDENSDEMLMTDKEYTVNNDTGLLWQIPENELSRNNTMSVKTKNKTYVLSLTYDKATDTRTVSCFEK